ncbi:MAG: PAS domain S-box protein [Balneolaceae bacterium]
MMQELLDKLKRYSKDDESFQKLKSLFAEIVDEKDQLEQSLELLERVTRNDYDSILVTELELEKPGPKIVYVNDGFTRITGYSKEEVIGKTPRILQGPKTDRDVLDKLKKRLLEGNSFFGHTVNYRKDGSEFVNQWDIHPLTNDLGEVTHWVSYQHDITTRKRSEKKIVDTGIEFDDLTEESMNLLVDVTTDGEIRSANRAFRDLVRYEESELQKIGLQGCIHEDTAGDLLKALQTGSSDELHDKLFEFRITDSQGKEIEVCAKARLIRANDEEIVRLSFYNRLRQKRILKILAKKTEGFERLFDKKTDFQYKVRDFDSGLRLFSVDNTFSLITGLNEDSESGIAIDEVVHVEDIDKAASHYYKVLDGVSHTEIIRYRTAAGDYLPLIDYARPVVSDDGTVEAIKGSASFEISSEKRGV